MHEPYFHDREPLPMIPVLPARFDIDCPDVAAYSVFTDGVARLYTSIAQTYGIAEPRDVEQAVLGAVKTTREVITEPTFTDRAHELANELTGINETNMRRVGYTDPEWLARWRSGTYKHHTFEALQELSAGTVLMAAAGELVLREELFDDMIAKKVGIHTKVSKAVVALCGVAATVKFGQIITSEDARTLPDLAVLGMNSFAGVFTARDLKPESQAKQMSARQMQAVRKVFKHVYGSGQIKTQAMNSIKATPRFPS